MQRVRGGVELTTTWENGPKSCRSCRTHGGPDLPVPGADGAQGGSEVVEMPLTVRGGELWVPGDRTLAILDVAPHGTGLGG